MILTTNFNITLQNTFVSTIYQRPFLMSLSLDIFYDI